MSQAHKPPWEEAQPHFEWDTHSQCHDSKEHTFFHGKLGFHHRCVRELSVLGKMFAGVGYEAHLAAL